MHAIYGLFHSREKESMTSIQYKHNFRLLVIIHRHVGSRLFGSKVSRITRSLSSDEIANKHPGSGETSPRKNTRNINTHKKPKPSDNACRESMKIRRSRDCRIAVLETPITGFRPVCTPAQLAGEGDATPLFSRSTRPRADNPFARDGHTCSSTGVEVESPE